jgi:hypothetical protein
MGIMSALMPLIGNPAYRTLFDYTLDETIDFPRSVLLLSGALAFWNATCNVFLSTQKSKMRLQGIDCDNEGNGNDGKGSEAYKDIKLKEIMKNSKRSSL